MRTLALEGFHLFYHWYWLTVPILWWLESPTVFSKCSRKDLCRLYILLINAWHFLRSIFVKNLIPRKNPNQWNLCIFHIPEPLLKVEAKAYRSAPTSSITSLWKYFCMPFDALAVWALSTKGQITISSIPRNGMGTRNSLNFFHHSQGVHWLHTLQKLVFLCFIFAKSVCMD